MHMRWKLPAGVLLATALLVAPTAAPAQVTTMSPALAAATCQTIVFKDLRQLIIIDLDSATDTQVRLLANQLLVEAKAEALTTLPGRIQARLDGTPADLRTFLKTGYQSSWATDLRIAVNRTMPGAGPNVQAAAQTALDNGTTDVFLAYLDHGLYFARAQDCIL